MRVEAKILLVEDDVSMGYLLTTILQTEGYDPRLCIEDVYKRQYLMRLKSLVTGNI